MNEQSNDQGAPLKIQTPCPMSWAELQGSGKRRFCSQCNLHVHDAAQLTASEAQSLVADSDSRVCMRLEYDAGGAPMFKDSDARRAARDHRRQPAPVRMLRWAMSAAAGLLAACQGSVAPPPPTAPSGTQGGTEAPSKMGEVHVPETRVELGDVALPQAQTTEVMGKIAAPSRLPEDPPAKGGN